MKIKLLEELMTSLQIAEYTGKRHDHVVRDIRKMLEDIGGVTAPQIWGAVSYKTNKGGSAIKKVATLNREQTYTLITGYSAKLRNSVIKRWMELEVENSRLKQAYQDRRALSDGYPQLSDALKESRDLLGKETKGYHYSNEADLLNRIVLGMTSRQYKNHHQVESVRDTLTALEKKVLAALQDIDKSLIQLGMDEFEDRKVKLTDYFNRVWSQKLIDEHIALEM